MLRNRKDTDVTKLRGVDLSRTPTKLDSGLFEHLENWVPGQLYSMKKKRGVELLETASTSPASPSESCG